MMTNHDIDKAERIAMLEKHEQAYVDLIKNRLGIVVHKHQLNDLRKSILTACKKFKCDPSGYLTTLSACVDNAPEFECLIQGITVGETYFFRDKHQVELLQTKLLPKIIEKQRQKNNLSIRIWSAGSASGEEIYTVAMMLFEMLEDADKWTLQLLGTDINTMSLRKAIKGEYTKWSMRAISDYYKEKYFSMHGDKFIIDERIKKIVNFAYLNLNDSTYPSMFNGTHQQDLLICRNVLIYFNADHIAAIMKKLSASLASDGFLLLGASDPIHYANSGLMPYPNEVSLLVPTK